MDVLVTFEMCLLDTMRVFFTKYDAHAGIYREIILRAGALCLNPPIEVSP